MLRERCATSAGSHRNLIADSQLAVVEYFGAYPLGVAVNDGARFTEACAATARRADFELAADEAIEIDAARDQVAAVLVRV